MKIPTLFETILLSSLLLAGCTTVIPPIASNSGPSFDGGQQNSGFLGWYTNSAHVVFGEITPHATDRYNGLIDTYHTKLPLISKNYGITTLNDGTNLITLEGLSDFIKMNRWSKQPAP